MIHLSVFITKYIFYSTFFFHNDCFPLSILKLLPRLPRLPRLSATKAKFRNKALSNYSKLQKVGNITGEIIYITPCSCHPRKLVDARGVLLDKRKSDTILQTYWCHCTGEREGNSREIIKILEEGSELSRPLRCLIMYGCRTIRCGKRKTKKNG